MQAKQGPLRRDRVLAVIPTSQNAVCRDEETNGLPIPQFVGVFYEQPTWFRQIGHREGLPCAARYCGAVGATVRWAHDCFPVIIKGNEQRQCWESVVLNAKSGPRIRHSVPEGAPYETITIDKLTPVIGAEIG